MLCIIRLLLLSNRPFLGFFRNLLGTYGCTGTYFLSRFMPASDYPINLVELVGTFADSERTIAGTPFPVGDGPTTLKVPSGATQLQLGANDCLFSDNSRLWGVTISGKPR